MKGIVDAILDRHLDEKALVDATLAEAAKQRPRLALALRRLMRARGPIEAKREAWRRAFREIVLAAAAPAIPAAIALVRRSLLAEARAVRAAGGAHHLRAVPALRKADIMRREAERKGLTDGEAPPAR